MYKADKLFLFFLTILLSSFLFYTAKAAEDNFNPEYIISDSEILDYNSMTLEEIETFLQDKGGYLSNYSCLNSDEEEMTAAEAIYDRAQANKISPKFLIVLLQKEQSLIEDDSPKQSQLDWATGYGCPDGSSCNPRWQGFWKQINSASLQFFDYIENPHLYTYRAGETYTFTNPYSTTKQETTVVTPQNQATAALYNYTPHVYNGNYNFYKIWQRYFTKKYFEGALLQVEGEAGVWLIQDGKKRPFLSQGALTSRFDPKKIIQVNKADLDSYSKGAPIKFPNYSLIRSPRGDIYLLVDNKRRLISGNEVFRQIGFNPEEVMDASWEDIGGYQTGQPITADSVYPTGALLQNNETGGVYWFSEGNKAPIWDSVFLKTLFTDKKIIPVTPEELDEYETISPVTFPDGELVKSSSSPAVYLVSEGKKRPFASGTAFENYGFDWENIITISPQVLALYEIGEIITE